MTKADRLMCNNSKKSLKYARAHIVQLKQALRFILHKITQKGVTIPVNFTRM